MAAIPPVAPEEIPALQDAALRQRLRVLLLASPTVTGGSLQLIGLEALRARVGPRWERVKDRVLMLAERLLHQHLSPHDVWLQVGPDRFLVLFADGSRAEAVCARLVAQLQEMLLGSEETRDIGVQARLGQVDGRQGAEGESLHALLRQTGAPTPPPPRPDPLASVHLAFRPVWDARHQVVSIYLARPWRDREDGHRLWGHETAEHWGDPHSILALDLAMLERALEQLQDLYNNRFRCLLSLPLHFESLAVLARRRQVHALLRAVPPHLQSLLIFHLAGLPSGIPVGRLTELAYAVRPFCRAVMALQDLGAGDLPTYAAAGLQGAGTRLSPRADPDRAFRDLLKFGHQARKLRLDAFVEGIDRRPLCLEAEKADIGYLTGDLIGGWRDTPEHMRRFSRDEVLSGLLT